MNQRTHSNASTAAPKTTRAGWRTSAGLAVLASFAMASTAVGASPQEAAPAPEARPVKQSGAADMNDRAAQAIIQVGEALKAGTVTRAEAAKRLDGILGRLRPAPAKAEGRDLRAEGAKVQAELEAAVKSGQITQAQADERMKSWREQAAKVVNASAPAQGNARAEYAAAAKELEAAVASGKLTREDAEKRLAGLRKSLAKGEVKVDGAKQEAAKGKNAGARDRRARYAEAEAQMKALVAEGKLTQEAMDERLAEMRAQLTKKADARKADAQEGEAQKGEAQKGAEKAKAGVKVDPRTAFVDFEKKVRAAVTDGILTEEEARAKLAEAAKRLGAGR